MSLLRWPHDHHRDLRARLSTAASADSSDDRNQDRHLMTMLELPRRKAARVFRRCPTGHDGTRGKSASTPVLAYQSASVDRPSPSNAGRSSLPNSAIVTIDHRRRAPLLRPPRSNPHSARRAATARPIAVSSLGGFRTPAPGVCRTTVMGRHPKTFTRAVIRRQGPSLLTSTIPPLPRVHQGRNGSALRREPRHEYLARLMRKVTFEVALTG